MMLVYGAGFESGEAGAFLEIFLESGWFSKDHEEATAELSIPRGVGSGGDDTHP